MPSGENGLLKITLEAQIEVEIQVSADDNLSDIRERAEREAEIQGVSYIPLWYIRECSDMPELCETT